MSFICVVVKFVSYMIFFFFFFFFVIMCIFFFFSFSLSLYVSIYLPLSGIIYNSVFCFCVPFLHPVLSPWTLPLSREYKFNPREFSFAQLSDVRGNFVCFSWLDRLFKRIFTSQSIYGPKTNESKTHDLIISCVSVHILSHRKGSPRVLLIIFRLVSKFELRANDLSSVVRLSAQNLILIHLTLHRLMRFDCSELIELWYFFLSSSE